MTPGTWLPFAENKLKLSIHDAIICRAWLWPWIWVTDHLTVSEPLFSFRSVLSDSWQPVSLASTLPFVSGLFMFESSCFVQYVHSRKICLLHTWPFERRVSLQAFYSSSCHLSMWPPGCLWGKCQVLIRLTPGIIWFLTLVRKYGSVGESLGVCLLVSFPWVTVVVIVLGISF